MKNTLSLIGFILFCILVFNSTYTLNETKQGLILQLGRVVGLEKEPGLHWKLPFIQNIRTFDKRILQLDGIPSEVPTVDRKFIWIETTTRWRIENPLIFYKALREINTAQLRMSTIIDGVTKDTVSNYNLIELVRNSNKILQDVEDNRLEAKQALLQKTGDISLDDLDQSIETIKFGREKISKLITKRSREELKNFGITVIDTQLKRIAYKEVVEEKVYNRMISERMKIATKIRSAANGEKEKILGQLELSLKKIESEAYYQSQKIKGLAEAEATKIYAEAFEKDAQYYSFIKTLETYEKTLVGKGNFILSTNHDFLKGLGK